jgi:hypothetical protein
MVVDEVGEVIEEEVGEEIGEGVGEEVDEVVVMMESEVEDSGEGM